MCFGNTVRFPLIRTRHRSCASEHGFHFPRLLLDNLGFPGSVVSIVVSRSRAIEGKLAGAEAADPRGRSVGEAAVIREDGNNRLEW